MRNILLILVLVVALIHCQLSAFTHYETMLTTLASYQIAFPNLIMVTNITDMLPNAPLTAQGRKLVKVKLSSDVKTDKKVQNKLVIAGLDSTDTFGMELVYDLSFLLKSYFYDENVTKLLDNNQIHLIFNPNPDGSTAFFKGQNSHGRNSNGVDLNSNFPHGWNQTCGGSRAPTNPRFQGNTSASESEVQNIMQIFDAMRFATVVYVKRDITVNNNVTLSFSSGCLENRLNSSLVKMYQNLQDHLKNMADIAVKEINTAGDILSFAQNVYGSLAIQLDFKQANMESPLNRSQYERESRFYTPILTGILALNPTITLRVVKEDKITPVGPLLTIREVETSVKWSPNELHYGMMHIWLPEGNFQFTLQKPGYDAFVTNYNISNYIPKEIDVVMIREKNLILIATLLSASAMIFLVVLIIMSTLKFYEILRHRLNKEVPKTTTESPKTK